MAVGVNVRLPEADSVTTPPVTATPAPPAVIAVPLIAVIVRPAFSNVSLPSGANVTAVSSFVVAVSLLISATAVIAILTVPEADSVPSLEYLETVNKAKAMMRAVEMAEKGLD